MLSIRELCLLIMPFLILGASFIIHIYFILVLSICSPTNIF